MTDNIFIPCFYYTINPYSYVNTFSLSVPLSPLSLSPSSPAPSPPSPSPECLSALPPYTAAFHLDSDGSPPQIPERIRVQFIPLLLLHPPSTYLTFFSTSSFGPKRAQDTCISHFSFPNFLSARVTANSGLPIS